MARETIPPGSTSRGASHSCSAPGSALPWQVKLIPFYRKIRSLCLARGG
ncbi:MAG: hypothetical protein OEZ34_07050 [Spirochaetia bacterium]|nr:hypothetical protein [Spirochaetia bacterium]